MENIPLLWKITTGWKLRSVEKLFKYANLVISSNDLTLTKIKRTIIYLFFLLFTTCSQPNQDKTHYKGIATKYAWSTLEHLNIQTSLEHLCWNSFTVISFFFFFWNQPKTQKSFCINVSSADWSRMATQNRNVTAATITHSDPLFIFHNTSAVSIATNNKSMHYSFSSSHLSTTKPCSKWHCFFSPSRFCAVEWRNIWLLQQWCHSQRASQAASVPARQNLTNMLSFHFIT